MTQEAKILTGIGIATLLIVVGAAFFVGGKTSPEKTKNVSSDKVKLLVRDTSHTEGTKGAKVTIVEFGDFQCPACGSAYPTVAKIIEDYKGKVTFVFRQYPLPVHQNAKVAALAAEAAGGQDKFFEMYGQLYENQKAWSESKKPVDEYFVKYAKEIGLDVNQFKKDVEQKKYEKNIQQDMNDAGAIGVSATPTFYINGEEIVGGLPYDEFKKKIEAALKAS